MVNLSKSKRGKWRLLGGVGLWIIFCVIVYISVFRFIANNEPELRQQFWSGKCNTLQTIRLRNVGETPINYSWLSLMGDPQDQMETALKKLEGWGCLPFGHYFILGIDTSHTDLVLSQTLKDQYPDDIWIYIEHRFRKVVVENQSVAVTVFFNDKPERIVIPIEAILYFGDPNYDFLIDLRDQSAAN